MASLDVSQYIINGFNSKEYSLGVFLDLSKAFDTVNHHILFSKLYHYGIRGVAYNWFMNYLSNRRQLVHIDNHFSSFSKVTCGVPQGSILGPLLFTLYINDIVNCSSSLYFTLFADDTSILYKHKDIYHAASTINSELTHVSTWCQVNRLSLNIDKTHFMIFHPNHSSIKNIEISLGNSKLKRVDVIKFLGLLIDPALNWSSHISKMKTTVSKTVGILYKIKDFVPKHILHNLYNTLIVTHLNYCNIVWGNTYSTHLNQLLILQKKAVRIITKSHFLAHTPPLFRSLNLLNIFDLHKYHCGIFIFHYINNLLPANFIDYFNFNHDIHNHNTRSSGQLFSLQVNSDIFKRSIVSFGVSFWNSLSPNLRNIKSLKSFSIKLKHHLIHINNHS